MVTVKQQRQEENNRRMDRLSRKRKRPSGSMSRNRICDSNQASNRSSPQGRPSADSSFSTLPKVRGRSASPARIVRLREHTELQSLNDRLSSVKATLQHKLSEVHLLQGELEKEQRKSKRLELELTFNKERYLKDMEDANSRFVQTVSSSLFSVRKQHKRDLEALRLDVTSVYQAKICEWKERFDRSQTEHLTSIAEVKATRQEYDELKKQMTEIKAAKAATEVQLQEAHSRTEEAKNQAEKDRCQFQKEMALLAQELSEVKEELEEVGGVNNQLDGEITAYRVLLDDLENKNFYYETRDSDGLDPVKLRSHEVSQGHTTKISHMKCVGRIGNGLNSGVKISEVDYLGQYIRLSNETDHCVELCMWMIQQTDCRSKKIQYEITSETRIAPGGCAIVWSQGQCPIKDESGRAANRASPFEMYNAQLEHDVQRPAFNQVHLTMSSKAWLPIRGRCRFVLKDGDGEKQNECVVTLTPPEAGQKVTGTRGQADPKPLCDVNLMTGVGAEPVDMDEVTSMDIGQEDAVVLLSTSTSSDMAPYPSPTTAPRQMYMDFDPRGGGDGAMKMDKDLCVIS